MVDNYKSICSNQNKILIEESVTTIIGKNESGKSNILEALGLVSYTKPLPKSYINNLTRDKDGDVQLIIEFDFYDHEKELNFPDEITKLVYKDIKTIEIKGGLQIVIKDDSELKNKFQYLFENRARREVWKSGVDTIKQVSDIITRISKYEDEVIWEIDNIVIRLLAMINVSFDESDRLKEIINSIAERLNSHYSFIPQVYYRATEKNLKSSYKLSEIDACIKDSNDLLKGFLDATKLSVDDIKNALAPSAIKGNRKTIRNRIMSQVTDCITTDFNTFYNQENIEFQIELDTNELSFFVHTDNKAMDLSERSNGLKWYLNLFIDLKAQNYEEKSTVFLIDEPGVFLHVNAQNELKQLLKTLGEKNNQVIFTTHSPFMIDESNINSLRAVEKDKNGVSKIFNNIYDSRLCIESKMETLSPLLNAIGANLKYNIGPYSKSNIITEGITDKLYITAMLKYLDITESPNIIPLVSVSNTRHVMAILLGWGCDFKAVLDFDNQGLIEYNAIKKGYGEIGTKSIVFINAISQPDDNKMKTQPMTIESLVSSEDMMKLNNPYNRESKKLTAKEFYDKVSTKRVALTVETVDAFKNLFEKLEILV